MANPPQIDLTVVTPPLPEGWQGTPDDLLAWYNNNTEYFFDGTFPTGQIGGSMPSQDIGIWYTPTSIESFQNGAYQPITDVPIGAILPFAGNVTQPPANYLFCDGSNYQQSTYPLLFAVIGGLWTPSSGIGTGTFNVPNMNGRSPVGSGTGNYNIITAASPTGVVGSMVPLVAGQYIGAEGLDGKTPIPTGGPTNFFTYPAGGLQPNAGNIQNVRNPAAVMPFIIRFR
jgi:prepilin-type processing-associated H-X9-DG protein